MHFFNRINALLIAVSACSLLSGCAMAVHALVSPMLDAGIQSAVERNATPESMGVSTAQFRGQDCASLKTQADSLTIEKTKPEHDAAVAKGLGFYVDAINQVRAEQGCDKPGQALSAAAAQVPMYGFCWYTTTQSRRHFVSTTFRYADWFTDLGKREEQQFSALLKSRYGQSPDNVICQGEDSQAKAEAARQKTWTMYRFANVSNTDVPWTPNTPAPQPLVATASPQAGSGLPALPVAVRPSTESPAAQGAFRASFDAVTPAFAKSLGLDSLAGALVVEARNSTAAENAGPRPLDVVTEVGGQIVKTPADLQAIVGRMRPGYKAQVRVWRQKTMRDVVIEVAAPAR
ncbi:MAG: PDZ domain-containing protein [Polaromonas sp.]